MNGTRRAADISNSGRFSLSVRKPVVVDMIVPAAGSQIERDVNDGMVDVFGDHLASDLASLASFCSRLNDNPQRRLARPRACARRGSRKVSRGARERRETRYGARIQNRI